MKIDGYPKLPESYLHKQGGSADHSAIASRPEGSASVPDEARLSVDLEKKRLLESGIAQIPDLRQDRIAPLRRAVQEGSYQPSDEQIAGAMLSELLD